MKKVIVAMSGGVDSSVSAALLQEQGFAVEGMFMKNWSPDSLQSLTDCPWEQDQADAAAVCELLGIPFRSINFEKEYRERVVDYFVREYAAGRTPNPDVMCNKEIKFNLFLEKALEYGADFIATGHYAQIKKETELWRGLDPQKDQSYFLYTLKAEQLRRTIFPIGHLSKRKVRELALSYRLPVAEKKDSQGICFIGHLDLKNFLHEFIKSSKGRFYLLPPYQANRSFAQRLELAVEMGQHEGGAFYTIGERTGAGVDNGLYRKVRENADVPPLYILDKQGNDLYITESHLDPDFCVKEVALSDWNYTGKSGDLLPSQLENTVCQVRYQQKELVSVERVIFEEGKVRVLLGVNPPLRAVAEGQSLVIYSKEGRVLAGGVVAGVVR